MHSEETEVALSLIWIVILCEQTSELSLSYQADLVRFFCLLLSFDDTGFLKAKTTGLVDPSWFG